MDRFEIPAFTVSFADDTMSLTGNTSKPTKGTIKVSKMVLKR